MASSRLTDAQLPEYIMIRIKSVRNNTATCLGWPASASAKLFSSISMQKTFARQSFFGAKTSTSSFRFQKFGKVFQKDICFWQIGLEFHFCKLQGYRYPNLNFIFWKILSVRNFYNESEKHHKTYENICMLFLL